MASCLPSLPLELLILLNQHLDSVHDRYQLCLVNRSLYDVFRDHLLHTLQLDTINQVIGVCHRLSKEPHLFHQVHQVAINVPFAPTCPYSALLCYCRNLTNLTLGEQFWNPADEDVEQQTWDEMAVDLDAYADMPQLRVLIVDCKHTYGVDDLFPLLSKCPGLKELRLKRLMWLTMPAEMEHIHELCPKLSVVQLDHKDAIPNLTDFLPPVLTTTNGPCLSMQTLDFTHDGLWDDFVPWLEYISVKYPFLTTFAINMVPTWTNTARQSDTVQVGQVQSAVRKLVRACLCIRSIQFNQVWWAKDFFRTRINQLEPNVKDLDQVTLIGQPYSVFHTAQWWTTIDKTFHLFSVAAADHIRALTVSMQPRPFFKPLRLAHCLVQLTLVTHTDDPSIVDPRLFLSLCPSLRCLVMEGGRVELDRQGTSVTGRSTTVSMPQYHLLAQLVLKRCTFSNQVLASISQYCPVLRALTLTSCILHNATSIQVRFPYHTLRTVRLNQVRVQPPRSSKPRPIEFITIQRYHSTTSTPSLMSRYNPTPRLLTAHAGTKRLLDNGGPVVHKTQSFKVTLMHYQRTRSHRDDEVEELDMPLEIITSVKCLSSREIDYYQSQAGVPLISPMEHASKRQCPPKRTLQDRQTNKQDEPVVQAKFVTNVFGGHLLVDVYTVGELRINGKWIVL